MVAVMEASCSWCRRTSHCARTCRTFGIQIGGGLANLDGLCKLADLSGLLVRRRSTARGIAWQAAGGPNWQVNEMGNVSTTLNDGLHTRYRQFIDILKQP
jgi:hypothetical protein